MQGNSEWRVPFEGHWTEEPINGTKNKSWYVHSDLPAKVMFPVRWINHPDYGIQALVSYENETVVFATSPGKAFLVKEGSSGKNYELQIAKACEVINWHITSQIDGIDELRQFRSGDQITLFIRLLVDAFPSIDLSKGWPNFHTLAKQTVGFTPRFLTDCENGMYLS